MSSMICIDKRQTLWWTISRVALRDSMAWLLAVTLSVTALAENVFAVDLMLVEQGASSKRIGSHVVQPLAILEFQNGVEIEFIDVGDGHVGIAERSPVRAPFIMPWLVSQWDATPLEIYRAFAPNGPRLIALETDHNLRMAQVGRDPAEPRLLNIPGEVFALDDPGLEAYDCDAFGYWITEWKDTFEGVTDHSDATFIHQFQGPWTFYPGSKVHTNRKTYLGACNGYSENNLIMEIDRWAVSNVIYNPYPNPPTVVWDWVKIHEISIAELHKYTFYSSHPNGHYRFRLQAESGVVEHVGAGAAWTKSFPVVGISSK